MVVNWRLLPSFHVRKRSSYSADLSEPPTYYTLCYVKSMRTAWYPLGMDRALRIAKHFSKPVSKFCATLSHFSPKIFGILIICKKVAWKLGSLLQTILLNSHFYMFYIFQVAHTKKSQPRSWVWSHHKHLSYISNCFVLFNLTFLWGLGTFFNFFC